MTQTVTIYIDDKAYDVPAGMNLVDAAKYYADNDVPVFCYHPKMKPVGMCHMCVVEMGTIQKDRESGATLLDDKGNAQIRWFPKLQTACTTTVSDGLVIRTTTQQVDAARESVLEFLLTSHPLDCPICDKGGECPLQNLTLEHGPGTSRMNYNDKKHLDKHVPLGDLIFLDEERCIQCARCIRFQDEIVGDDVLAFHERGRSLQIVTVSEPGFDTYFSGNTTDICPVGALTTADFRFGARPWELTNIPSVCPHCPVGCNTTLSTRLDRDFNGRAMIKRVMPRQNEEVNEIWLCDKGRFGHHFTRAEDRLTQPMIRNSSGALNPATWQEAFQAVAARIGGGMQSEVAVIAGAGISNEDAYALRALVDENARLGAWTLPHAGMDIVAQVGVGNDSALKELGKGDAVLVIANDLEEEAPVWRLQVKQAYDHGAYVVVANARATRMDDFASATIRYNTGDAVAALLNLRADNAEIADALTNATNLIIIAGAEGLTHDGSRALMQAAANFLIDTNHVGTANNGLIGVFPGANAMGLHYMGFSPEATLDIINHPPKVLIVAGADVAGELPDAAWLDGVETIIALALFPDATTQRATIVLPMQSFAERDGTFTNGLRRVQRFYTAQGPIGSSLPAWQIAERSAEALGNGRALPSAAAVMLEITKTIPEFAGVRYNELAKVSKQFPDVGGQDLYYGGTAYKNTGGLGVVIPSAAEAGETMSAADVSAPDPVSAQDGLVIVPTTELYNRAPTFEPSAAEVMEARIPQPYIEINAADAARLNISDGDTVEVAFATGSVQVRAHVNGKAPQGSALLPRHLTDAPTPHTLAVGAISKVEG